MNFVLQVIAGPDAGRRIPLAKRDTLLVGRNADCGLALNDGSVSRVHCKVVTDGDSVYVADAGSRWGTTVNGAPATSAALAAGDIVELGDTQIRLDAVTPTGTMVARRPAGAQPQEQARGVGASEDFEPDDSEPGSEHLNENDAPAPPEKPAAARPRKPSSAVLPVRERKHDRLPRVQSLDALVGETFVKYRVGSLIARTSSGCVFRALDTRLSRTVALKVFRPAMFTDSRSTERFLRAMRATMPLEHENLVKLHSAGRTRGVCFTVSEFIEGESVREMIRNVGIAGMLDWRRAWQIAVGTARALEFAHERGIIHRNVLPGNILVRKSDQSVKLGDLMLAKAFDDAGAAALTRPGEIVGDVCYLAPEQIEGNRPPDGRADIYCLGSALYAVLTGRPPFEGSTAEVVRRVLTEKPEPPTRRHLAIPVPFEGLILRMLAKRPEERFDSVAALLKDLTRFGKFQGLEL